MNPLIRRIFLRISFTSDLTAGGLKIKTDLCIRLKLGKNLSLSLKNLLESLKQRILMFILNGAEIERNPILAIANRLYP